MRLSRVTGETVAVMAVALLAAAATAAPAHVVGHLREILSVPILILPGWAICRAIFGEEALGLPERLAISGCITIAVLVLVGLALNALPGGLDRVSWSWSLIAVTLVASGVTLVSRRSGTPITGGSHWPGIGTWLGALIALILMVAGLALARHSAVKHDEATRFTQLWMLPGASAHVIDYGVTNSEGRPDRYALTATINGSHRALLRSGWFVLGPGKSRSGTISVPLHGSPTVILDLYKAGGPSGSPYRSTKLVLR